MFIKLPQFQEFQQALTCLNLSSFTLSSGSFPVTMSVAKSYDAIVVGAGPNGLAAAIELARAGHSVCIFEANEMIGGGARSAELTLAGFVHDICSAVHPLATQCHSVLVRLKN